MYLQSRDQGVFIWKMVSLKFGIWNLDSVCGVSSLLFLSTLVANVFNLIPNMSLYLIETAYEIYFNLGIPVMYDYFNQNVYSSVSAFQNMTLYNTYNLFHLHVCQVCGSFQCPYCPYYNAAPTIAYNLVTFINILVCLRILL